jgi:hypothetical protein
MRSGCYAKADFKCYDRITNTMSIIIERIALQIVLCGILSGQCPISEGVENALMTELRQNGKPGDDGYLRYFKRRNEDEHHHW